MKKFLTILMITMMLLMFVSCDGGITDFMGQMGQNVMGSDTSKATEAAESTKVDESEIEEKKAGSNIELPGGISVSVDKDVTLLPPIDNNKDQVISNIGASLTNDANRDALIKEMSKSPSGAVQEAASGTATVMVKAIEQIVGKENVETLPDNIKDVLNSVKDALNTISDKPETVTQADVVTLQLVTDMVGSLNKNAEKIQNGEIPPELLTDANNLVTVVSAISAAGNFNALEDINISDLIPDMGGKAETPAAQGRVVRSEGDYFEVDIASDKESLAQMVKYYRAMYKLVVGISGTDADAFDLRSSGLALHKFAFENYVTLVGSLPDAEKALYTSSKLFKDFATYNNVLKYAVVSVLSLSDPLFDEMERQLPEVELGKYKNLIGLLVAIADINPWMKDDGAYNIEKLYLPAEFKNISENENFDGEMLVYKLESFIKAKNSTMKDSLMSTFNTIETLVPYVGLDAFGEDITKVLSEAKEWLNKDPVKPGTETIEEVR